MHNHPDEHTRYLVSALYRYTQALESGDLEGVADILSLAEQDSLLERLLLEINEVYQEADTLSVSPAELARVQNFLTPLLTQKTILMSNGSDPQIEHQQALPMWQHDIQERKQETMQDSGHTATTIEPPSRGESNRPVRKRRLTHFMQMFAATLVVGALLVGFLTLLGSRHPGTPGSSSSTASSASSVVALNSSDGTVYALRPADGTVLWHYATGIVDPTLGSDTSLAVLNHVVYFAVRGRVFAFQSTTGKLLWRQDVLPASAHVFGSTSYTFALDENVLLVRLANNNGETSVLFALRATNGSILWHYDMNFGNLMIASHSIVYIRTSDASGSSPTLRALRVTDGKELWNYNKPFTLVTILAIGKVLYLQADTYLPPVSNYANVQESLIALNALTGAFIWSKPVQNANLEVSGGDMGLMLSENGGPVLYNGYQFCAYRGSDGAQLWCSHDFAPHQAHTGALIPNFYTPAGQVLATLRLVNGKTNFYLKLEALSLKTGKTLWDTIPTFTKGTHSPVSEGAIGALISSDSRAIYAVVGVDVYAYNASNGQVLWHIVSHITGNASYDRGITGLAVG